MKKSKELIYIQSYNNFMWSSTLPNVPQGTPTSFHVKQEGLNISFKILLWQFAICQKSIFTFIILFTASLDKTEAMLNDTVFFSAKLIKMNLGKDG